MIYTWVLVVALGSWNTALAEFQTEAACKAALFVVLLDDPYRDRWLGKSRDGICVRIPDTHRVKCGGAP